MNSIRMRIVLIVTIVLSLILGSTALVLLRMDNNGVSEGQHQESFVSDAGSRPFEHMQVPLHDWELNYRISEQKELGDGMAKSNRIFGGIVPHHLAAQSFIAEMFRMLADREKVPKTVVILSPNHAEAGEPFIQTVNGIWETPDGFVETDAMKVDEIARYFETPLQNEALRGEHGVYNILPFVRHFLPGTKVVPITLRFATPKNDQDVLVELLSRWLSQSEDVVVIASIDFSHYLSSEEAKRKDEETRISMQQHDYSEIASYRSDHLDTPTGLLVLLRTMRLVGADRQTILQYDNSGETLGRPFAKTTSHFLVIFTKEDKL